MDTGAEKRCLRFLAPTYPLAFSRSVAILFYIPTFEPYIIKL